MLNKKSYSQWPDEKGYFGQFGGRYVSETLMPLIMEVEKEYNNMKNDSSFKKKFDYLIMGQDRSIAQEVMAALGLGQKRTLEEKDVGLSEPIQLPVGSSDQAQKLADFLQNQNRIIFHETISILVKLFQVDWKL